MRALQCANVASDVDDLIHRSQRPFRLAKERPAFLGGYKPLALPRKQRQPQLLFQVANQSAHGRLCHVQSLRGAGEPVRIIEEYVDDFLGGLDFLVIAMPLTQRSTGLVGEMEFRALPRTAFLLHPSRGPIVKEEALLSALRLGWIAGAALDTHFAYPLPADHPLWRFPNVIITPHVSGIDRSEAFPARMGELFASRFKEKTRDEWCTVMEGTDICFAPVLSFQEAPDHPHNKARGSYVEVDGIVQPGPAPRFSRTPSRVKFGPPAFGGQTAETLAQWGFSHGEIVELQKAKAVGRQS